MCQPFTTTTVAKRAFRCSAPAVWNSLPKTVLSSDSVAVFKSRLKTFLFYQAFSSFSAHQHAVWPQRLWSYDLIPLYKSVYYYYYSQRSDSSLLQTEVRSPFQRTCPYMQQNFSDLASWYCLFVAEQCHHKLLQGDNYDLDRWSLVWASLHHTKWPHIL